MNNRLLKIKNLLIENDFKVIDNSEYNGIICCGFYIFDKVDHFRIFKNSHFFDLVKSSSVVDFIVNNSCSMVITIA